MTAMNEIIEKIQILLPENIIRETETTKTNDKTYTGVTISEEGTDIAPVFYISEKDLLCSSSDNLAIKIVNLYKDQYKKSQNFSSIPEFISKYESVFSYLTIQIINHDMNQHLLENIPSKRFLDLDIIVIVNFQAEDDSTAVIKVTNNLLKMWNISFDEVYSTAYHNFITNKYELININSLLDFYGYEFDDVLPMFILTNSMKHLGAAYICSNRIMNEIAELFNCDLIVIPSSVHECIIMPRNAFVDDLDENSINLLVNDVNTSMVKYEEVLSNHIYIYRKDLGWDIEDEF